MECDRITLPASELAAVAMVVAAWFTIATGDVHAQPAPDVVVTSPHVWQPGGSEPPYGVQVLPGGSADLTLVFENRGSETVPRYEFSLPVAEGRLDVTARYPADPSIDARCGPLERIPNNSAFGGGYRSAVGPISPGAVLACSWRIRRIADGPDLVVRAPIVNQFIHIGTITDIEIRIEQLTPMIAGVSRSAIFSMTTVNPGAVDLVRTPSLGMCTDNLGAAAPRYMPDGPEPCAQGGLWCFMGGSAVSVGLVPAGQYRRCTFSIQLSAPVSRLGTFPIPSQYDSSWVGSTAGNIYDPNPSNSSPRPMVTVSAESIPAFGHWLAPLFMLASLLAAAALHRLRAS